MTNQDIIDHLDFTLSEIIASEPGIREKILDAVWDVLQDHRAEPEEN